MYLNGKSQNARVCHDASKQWTHNHAPIGNVCFRAPRCIYYFQNLSKPITYLTCNFMILPLVRYITDVDTCLTRCLHVCLLTHNKYGVAYMPIIHVMCAFVVDFFGIVYASSAQTTHGFVPGLMNTSLYTVSLCYNYTCNDSGGGTHDARAKLAQAQVYIEHLGLLHANRLLWG